MCKKGNQTVNVACYVEAIKRVKKPNPSNQEIQRLVKENGGCLKPAAVTRDGL